VRVAVSYEQLLQLRFVRRNNVEVPGESTSSLSAQVSYRFTKKMRVVPNFCKTLIGLSKAVIFLDGQRSR
jgi:hypothetical protein